MRSTILHYAVGIISLGKAKLHGLLQTVNSCNIISIGMRMISVPFGTGDIADAMISASQMIYASRMKERILYHACEASISYGIAVYHIALAIYH